jgi:CSLREA domain-containing protein
VGAFALASPAAAAADFEVNTLSDAAADGCTAGPGGCTLRDAITDANTTGGPDTITFASGLTGELRLTQAANLVIQSGDNTATTIDGPGAGVISISGDADNNGQDMGDVRIFNVGGLGPTTISGLTLTEGFADGGAGGAILNNTTGAGELTITESTIIGNTATGSGGAIGPNSDDAGKLTVTDSTISGNSATGGSGGGIDGAKYSGTTVTNSTISGNSTAFAGGGIVAGGKYSPLKVTGSTISGNTAAGISGGGGIFFSASSGPGSAPATSEIRNTTISGNHATGAGAPGAGVTIGGLIAGDQFTISHSTIFGNDGGAGSFGGGLAFISTLSGAFELSDATISGNVAETGAGVSLGQPGGTALLTGTGSLALDNSTIASNTATVRGGGLYLASYGGGPTSATIPLGSTIVGNNIANGAPQDLDRADGSTGGGFNLAFSLVEAPGDAPVNQTSPSILGVDPLLNVIDNNGGPTQTMLPLTTSAVIDKGAANGLSTDQRGFPRTVDGTGVPNPADGTDIGSVELSNPPAAAVAKKKCKVKKKKGKKGSAESAKKKHKKKKKCKRKKKKKGKR